MRLTAVALVAGAGILLTAQSSVSPVQQISVNGANFAYVESGSGDPVMLVHGGLQDYRLWNDHLAVFAAKYRVIAYSRRNHFPNAVSADGTPDFAADIHAEDLAGLIAALGIRRPHVVAHSSGATTALFFAARYPGVARTLVLNEPNAVSLLSAAPDATTVIREFTERLAAARDAFRSRDLDRAMPLWADAVGGPGSWARRADIERRMNFDNALANVADQISPRPRAPFTCDMARGIATPTLLSQGERSPRFFNVIVSILDQCLPTRERVTIPQASHNVPRDNPTAYQDAVLAFFAKY